MFLRFIHFVVCISSLFTFIAESCFIEWLCYMLFICLTVDGHLGPFQFLGVMNTVVMSSCMEVLVWMHVFIFLE